MGDLAVEGWMPVHLKFIPLKEARKSFVKRNFKSFIVVLIRSLFNLSLT